MRHANYIISCLSIVWRSIHRALISLYSGGFGNAWVCLERWFVDQTQAHCTPTAVFWGVLVPSILGPLVFEPLIGAETEVPKGNLLAPAVAQEPYCWWRKLPGRLNAVQRHTAMTHAHALLYMNLHYIWRMIYIYIYCIYIYIYVCVCLCEGHGCLKISNRALLYM